MTDTEHRVIEALKRHQMQVSLSDRLNVWRQTDAAYRTAFWYEPGDAGRRVFRSKNTYLLSETNQVAPWVDSLVGALFYSGVKVTVSPTIAQPSPPPSNAAPALARLSEAWLTQQEITASLKYALQLGLLGAECALYLHDTGVAAPLRRYAVEVVPPTCCVWDRRAAKPLEIGVLRWVEIDSDEGVELGLEVGDVSMRPRHWCDTLQAGSAVDGNAGQDSAALVLCWYDVRRRDAAVYQKFVVRNGGIVRALGAAEPWTQLDADGVPVLPVVPVVLANAPGKPLEGVCPAEPIWNVNARRNAVDTIALNAAMRGNARKLMVVPERFPSPEDREALADEVDTAIVNTVAGDLSQAAAWMDQPPVDPGLVTLMNSIREQSADVQSVAGFVRGEQTKYATATEIAELSSYTQNSLGQITSRYDQALAALVCAWIRLYGSVADRALSWSEGATAYDLVPTDFLFRWVVEVRDTTGSPSATNAQRRALAEAMPMLLQLGQLYEQAQGPLKSLAKALQSEVVARWQLPEGLALSHLEQAAETSPEVQAAELVEAETQGSDDGTVAEPPV